MKFDSTLAFWGGVSSCGVVAAIVTGAVYGPFAGIRVLAGLVLGLLAALLVKAYFGADR